MDERMGHGLCSGTELKHRQNLGERITSQPEPQHLFGAPKPGAQFVQLEVRAVQIAEGARVQGLSVLARTRQPEGDSRLTIAEDAFRRGRIQPFSQSREHNGDLLGRGFQPVQGGITSSTEGGMASRTSKGLDRFSLTMLAVPNQGMNLSIDDPEVRTLLIWTGEAVGVNPLRCSPPAFDLAPGTHQSRCWTSTCRGQGGETAGGAIIWAARLEQPGE